ncbi:hypothetical protein F8M41_020032 [Gigaspora margarita]|uniref:Uncharacterized protein n=1 Tax=Gigaspora margarita TaxID=4874 RepID=A0A8H4AIY7_GIGMA|nr:hypothetical protein F8M41_020032 [Gigaspora margarita]
MTIFLIVIMRTIEALPLKLRSQTLTPSVTSSPSMTPLPNTNVFPPTGVNLNSLDNTQNLNANPNNTLPKNQSYPIVNDVIPVTHVLPQATQVNPSTLPKNISPLGGVLYGNNHNIVPFMYKRSNNAYSIPYNNIYKRRMIPNFGMYHNNPHLYRRNSPLMPIIGNVYHQGAWF